jgi:hypothetical protein
MSLAVVRRAPPLGTTRSRTSAGVTRTPYPRLRRSRRPMKMCLSGEVYLARPFASRLRGTLPWLWFALTRLVMSTRTKKRLC